MRVFDLLIANLRDAVLLHPLFPFRHFAPVLGLSEMSFNVRGCGPIRFRTGNSDAITVRSVFRDLGYDVGGFPQAGSIMAVYQAILSSGKVPVLIDAGANIGCASRWFAAKFPSARIIAVEPEPRNAAMCRRNVAHLPNVQVIEAALGSHAGKIAISDNTAKSWAFTTARSDDGTIPIVTMPQLASLVPNGLLFGAKIDIEGFESDVFSKNTDWVHDLKFFFVEPHDWALPEQRSSRALQKRMAEADFDLIVAGENLLYVAADRA